MTKRMGWWAAGWMVGSIASLAGMPALTEAATEADRAIRLVQVQAQTDELPSTEEPGTGSENPTQSRPNPSGRVAPPPGTASEQAPESLGFQEAPSTGGSLVSDFDARIVIYTILITLFVVFLLGGAMVIVNFALLSKRPQDHVGGRTPSDVALLRGTVWPPEAPEERILPAMDEEEEEEPETINVLGEATPSIARDRQSISSRGQSLAEQRQRGIEGDAGKKRAG